jgi:hypothetical protein
VPGRLAIAANRAACCVWPEPSAAHAMAVANATHRRSSLRLLGRKVYLPAVVVPIAVLREGATPIRMRRLPTHD